MGGVGVSDRSTNVNYFDKGGWLIYGNITGGALEFGLLGSNGKVVFRVWRANLCGARSSCKVR
jgi:hypothetical protein